MTRQFRRLTGGTELGANATERHGGFWQHEPGTCRLASAFTCKSQTKVSFMNYTGSRAARAYAVVYARPQIR